MSDGRDLENKEMYKEEELGTIILTLENNEEVGCGILGVFEVEGYDSDYIALVSKDDSETMIYKYEEINGKEVGLDVIEDDAKYEEAKETFESLSVDFGREDEE